MANPDWPELAAWSALQPAQPQAKYDGAGRGRRGQRWLADDRTPGEEVRASLHWLRRRSRDVFKNNGWARRGITLIAQEAVGTGITLNMPERRGNARMRSRIKAWMDSPLCSVGGRLNFYALQAACVDAMVRDGEVLVRRITQREPRSGLPLKLQLLRADWLDTLNDGPLANGGGIANGIEYNAAGERVAYHIKRAIDTDLWKTLAADPIRVPAKDIIHLFRLDEPEQERGIPWLAPALWTVRDLGDYQDAQLVRQKLAAATVMKRTRADLAADPGEIGPDGSVRPRTEVYEPGTTIWIDPTKGEDAEFLSPPSVDGFDTTTTLSLRQVAVSLPVSYEALSGDFSETNYSSARLGWHLFGRSIDMTVWHSLVPHLCDGVLDWLRELEGADATTLPGLWMPPKREMLDPSKEVEPVIKKIRAGLTSRTAEIMKLGEDPAQVDAEQAADNSRADDLGLSHDSDGRRPLAAPATPEAGKDTGTADDTEDKPKRD